MAYRRKTRKSYSSSKSYSPRKKASSRRSPQTVKLVIEHRQASPISRPDLQGLSLVEKPSKKARM